MNLHVHKLRHNTRRRVFAAGLAVVLVAVSGTAQAAEQSKPETLDLSVITIKAKEALESAPQVVVPDSMIIETETGVAAITPAPPPPPPPPPVQARRPRRTERTERTEEVRESPPEVRQEKAPPAAPEPPPPAVGGVVGIALSFVGVPYVSGGTDPSGFDCSGFTQYVYAQVGISIPRTSGSQRGAGVEVPRSEAQPGDLIWSPGHVAIYLGGDSQIDAPRPGSTIQVRNIWQDSPRFIRVG